MSDRLIFGRMHEDHSAELSRVPHLPVNRALVIASGGDLAFALAGAGVDVLAVDSNLAQIVLVKQKMAAPENAVALCFGGRVDRVLRFCGPFIAWLTDWHRLRPGRFRALLTNVMEAFLSGAVALIHGRTAGRKLDRVAVRLLRARLEQALRHPGAATNPLLQVLLGNRFGSEVPTVWSPSGIAQWKTALDRIELQTADLGKVLARISRALAAAACPMAFLLRSARIPEFTVCRHTAHPGILRAPCRQCHLAAPRDAILEKCGLVESTPGTFGLIVVSNLSDTMDEAAWDALVKQAATVVQPGGYLIARSMLRENVVSTSDPLFDREVVEMKDTSPLCPVVWIGKRNKNGIA